MVTSGCKPLPCSSLTILPAPSFINSCTWYSRPRVRPLFSSRLSKIISPQLPCILLLPFKAVARLFASWLTCALISISRCTSLPRENRSFDSLSYVSSTFCLNSVMLVFNGSSIWRMLCSLLSENFFELSSSIF